MLGTNQVGTVQCHTCHAFATKFQTHAGANEHGVSSKNNIAKSSTVEGACSYMYTKCSDSDLKMIKLPFPSAPVAIPLQNMKIPRTAGWGERGINTVPKNSNSGH